MALSKSTLEQKNISKIKGGWVEKLDIEGRRKDQRKDRRKLEGRIEGRSNQGSQEGRRKEGSEERGVE